MDELPVRALVDSEFPGEWGEGSPRFGLLECRVLRATNLASSGLDYSTAAQRYVPEAKVNLKRLRRGDVILEAAGGGPGVPVGRVARFDPPDEEWTYVVSNFFRTLRPARNADSRFVYHTLHYLYRQPAIWQVQQQTTGIINLKVRDYLQLRVSVPPLEEQRRIAEILDTIDETIQATERGIAKRKRMRAGLLSDLIYSRGRGELSQRSKPNRKSHAPDIPRISGSSETSEWQFATLQDLADILDNRRVPVREEDRPTGSVPYYGANGQQGWIDRPLFDEPLILLAEDGGHFAEFADRPIAYRIDGPSWVNNHAHVLRAATGVDQSFLYWSLRNKDIRRWISGGTRSKLTRGEMDQVVVPVPPLEEQRRIAAILDTFDETIRANEQQRDKLWRLRSGLAADLLSGRVRTVAS